MKSKASPKDATVEPQPWIVLRFNHFDPTWRRCWDREFVDDGRRFASYRAIEDRWIADAIAGSADGVSCFLVECSWVLRHYLERHPGHRNVLRRLAREGRFELLGSGENIVDANLIHGETLARNLVLGTLWAEETLGVRPTTGWHSDGFGSCAQMPQIFRQCGYDWLPAISYNTPDAPYWRGLDGSTIFFSCDARAPGQPRGDRRERLVHRLAVAGTCYVKLPPCPACQGKGCAECRKEGFSITRRAEFAAPPPARLPGEVGVMMLWGEEIMPGLHVAEEVARFNAAHPDIAVRQGTYLDLRAYVAGELARVDNPPPGQISSKVENNPSQSGCYVSRIKIKQQHRALEHALLAAECWDALLNGGANHARLRGAWRQMTFSAFHDAITSSHCDPAYTELCDLHRDLAALTLDIGATACRGVLKKRPATVTVFNHHSVAATVPVTVPVPARWQGAGVKADGVAVPAYAVEPGEKGATMTFLAADVPALGARTFTLGKAAVQATTAVSGHEVSNGRFTIRMGEHGITRLQAKGVGTVTDPAHFLFGELVLEHDIGDPWATRSLDRTRERLSPYTRLAGVERRGDEVTIRYAGKHPACNDPHFNDDPNVTYLAWEQAFRMRAGLPWLEVETRVKWYTQSRRLRLAFPSKTTLNRGVYEVPYGVLERDRYEGKTIHGGNAGGDWPALHWAGIQAPGHTFAIFNQGTPSYRVEDGIVMVSVLRSPQIPYGLFEPESYVAYNYDGMRDHGDHVFHHALYAVAGDWRHNDTVRQAALFNAGLPAVPGALAKPLPGWGIKAEHTSLTAVKTAEDGKGLILRLVETAGRSEAVQLTPPPAFGRAAVCTLLEDARTALPAVNGVFTVPVQPWKIVTVRLTP